MEPASHPRPPPDPPPPPPHHTEVEKRWVRVGNLGKGAHGTVYLERLEGLDTLRAVKEIKKSACAGRSYLREIEAIVKFSRPEYARWFVVSDDWWEIDDSIFISMQHLALGSLDSYISRPFPEVEARQISSQLLEGLKYMHANRFVHRDLKPGNIMVVTNRPEWLVKIADFSISTRYPPGVTPESTAEWGTRGYAAPEQLRLLPKVAAAKSFPYAVDIWSLGAVAYQTLTATVPDHLYDAAYLKGKKKFPDDTLRENKVSRSGIDFLAAAMNPLAESRPSASSALEDPWFTSNPPPVAWDQGPRGFDGGSQAPLQTAASAAWATTLVDSIKKRLSGNPPLIARRRGPRGLDGSSQAPLQTAASAAWTTALADQTKKSSRVYKFLGDTTRLYAGNWSTLPALEHAVEQRSGAVPLKHNVNFVDLDAYQRARSGVTQTKQALAFDFICFVNAGEKERSANAILQLLRQRDKRLFESAPPRRGYRNQLHERHPSDRHLANLDLVQRTEIFRVARRMPKGAHLRTLFNSCLEPCFLLDLAKDQERMDIGSNKALVNINDLYECEIQFTIRGNLAGRAEMLKRAPTRKFIGNPPKPPVLVNLFDRDRFDQSEGPADEIRWMNYKDFRDEFPRKFPAEDLDEWLTGKLVYTANEAHGVYQTAESTWAKFNKRIEMIQGLFNYETAYRQYTRRCLQDFVDDNIQYAEIRPNFIQANRVWSTDGRQLYDNYEIMEIITDECNHFLNMRDSAPFFQGIKVIYCTPRSLPDHLIRDSLDECLELKRSPEIGRMIAGFDLIGQKGAGRPLKDHVQNLLEFQSVCKTEGVEIPFLFHCGKTLETGTDADDITDAFLLGSKRIGHGSSLSRQPHIMEMMKAQNICLEVCPISDEVLGLTSKVSDHDIYNLLANNVHCTINSDAGTLFRSSLSHVFYQVFVGKEDFTLHGWRQLIEWSLEHACLDEDECTRVYGEWRKLWDEFLDWILETYQPALGTM